MQILFENDAYIAVNKTEYISVQANASGRENLQAQVAEFLVSRTKNSKQTPFIGLVHRIDQPVTGVVLFAKTENALAGINSAFQSRDVKKIYWAIVDAPLPDENGKLEHYLSFNSKRNKTIAKVLSADSPKTKHNLKKSLLHYKTVGKSERYFFLEIELITGRHHQIRAQLAAAGCHVKGDLKYGAARSNPGGGIHLHARFLSFCDPQSGQVIEITAPPPEDILWDIFPSYDKV